MTIVPLSHAKAHLARLLAEVEELGQEFVITRSGRPVGVLLPLEEYEGLLETLEILADPELLAGVRSGLEEVRDGILLSEDEVWSGMDDPLHS